MKNMTKEHLTEAQKYKVLNRTSFKNVSGNWQFNGDMTPERFIKILFTVLEESGSVAAPKEEDEVSKLMVYKIQAYEQLDELASLRQQLKEREEALKELLEILPPFVLNVKSKAIIERARKLISK